MDVPENFGLICFVEIPVTNVSRAQKFYEDIFGWKFVGVIPHADRDIQSMHFFKLGNGQDGALLLIKEDSEITNYGKHRKEFLPVMPTFCVTDCNVTLERVEAIGGTIEYPKTFFGGEMGHCARFTDTEGNMIAIWSKK